MKKIIAIMMALVMMMAITVPAFAAVVNENNEVTNSTDVYVKASTATATYTVTIPAEINLIWGADKTTKTYTITSQLAENDFVVVDATVGQALTHGTDTIAFTLQGDVTDIRADKEVVTDESHEFDVVVDENDWKAATIADYEGKITFEAAVVTVTPAP